MLLVLGKDMEGSLCHVREETTLMWAWERTGVSPRGWGCVCLGPRLSTCDGVECAFCGGGDGVRLGGDVAAAMTGNHVPDPLGLVNCTEKCFTLLSEAGISLSRATQESEPQGYLLAPGRQFVRPWLCGRCENRGQRRREPHLKGRGRRPFLSGHCKLPLREDRPWAVAA